MSFLGGILEPQDPSERVRHSLTRDLQLRRHRVIEEGRFVGYRYQGGADFVLRHGTFRPGRELPEAYRHLIGPESCCFANAEAAAQADPSLRYCEGYATSGFGTPILHAWCLAPDGGVVELTLPTIREERERYQTRLHLPFLPTEHWGYYGVDFDVRLVVHHDEGSDLGLPMLDRGPAELADPGFRAAGLDTSETHDFPILKVKYDPNRTELP